MHRLGIEQLSVFSLPPVAYVGLAADLGCETISLGLTGTGYDPEGHAPWSLRDDPVLRRETKAALRDRGVAIALGEGCLLRPGVAPQDLAADMDLLADLGCERINTLSIDRAMDLAQLHDQFALFAQMVADRGMVSTVEIVPMLPIGGLDPAIALLDHVGRADFRLLLDTMHLRRLRITPDQIAALDPGRIGYVQLCDIADSLKGADYMEAALYERLVPGTGDVPFAAYLAALPDGLTYGLEVPQRSLALAGLGPHARLEPSVLAARALLKDA